jgi:hypothetical protein
MVVHALIEIGRITSDDLGMTAFGFTEGRLLNEQSRVSGELASNPK